MKILLIEDDIESASYVVAALNGEHYDVEHVTSGSEGLKRLIDGTYDVTIVDRMLPGIDGLNLVRAIRSAQVVTRVIFVTTRADIDDRVEGLNAGGDDYLTKPFAMPELLARVAALGRRHEPGHHDTVLRIGDLEFDFIRRHVKRGGRTLELQPQDERLLEVLMRNAGRIVTRTMLLETVWDFHFDPKTTIVETQISRLRSKIDLAAEPSLIETVRGSGYRFRNAR